MAIAPTANHCQYLWCKVHQLNLFIKTYLLNPIYLVNFTVVNPYLVTELKQLGIWDLAMVEDLKYYNGTLSAIERIPNSIKTNTKPLLK